MGTSIISFSITLTLLSVLGGTYGMGLIEMLKYLNSPSGEPMLEKCGEYGTVPSIENEIIPLEELPFLKDGFEDNRIKFLEKLIKKIPNIKYDFRGFGDKQPIWGNDFNRAIINCKMGLNLSRGAPTKYYSSNRIASILGNGLLTFIDKKTQLDDFFSNKEVIFYKNIDDLASKIKFYSKNDTLRKKIAKSGQNKYFKLFNESKIAKHIVDISLGNKSDLF